MIERPGRSPGGSAVHFYRTRLIMLPTPELVKNYIAAGLECTHLEVEGDGQHFNAVIVSPAFAGKRLIQRHQLVYAALGDRMREEIHALSMKTLTPEEFQK
jgi:acid stress-induced BolA-like protein IbaG/YrbA